MDEKGKKTVAFYTLGCKVNQYETNAMMQKFIEHGYKITSKEEKADIYIINTCTVTNMSDKKSRQMIRRAKMLNKDSVIVAVGCYAQVAKEDIEKNIKEIDLVLGTNEKNNIIECIEEYMVNKKKKFLTSDVLKQKEFLDFGDVVYTEKTRAVIKVQDGCDRFCSYCIIPYARGRVRSRKLENVLSEVKKIAENNIKEVVITGIHIASYGKDFNDGTSLIDLLEELDKIDGIERIRLGSLEPMIITNDFVERLKKLNKICHHFHLSLQSGCNDTLKRMNRRYTIEEFENVCMNLRKAFVDVLLTTDVIVGFPGETEEEFNKTYEFLKKIKFYEMHIFKYSKRAGTKAAIMEEQIAPEIKEIRSKKLIELSKENQKSYMNGFLGKEETVLFETSDKKYTFGHTSNYLVIGVKKDSNIENCMKKVKLESIENDYLLGNVE